MILPVGTIVAARYTYGDEIQLWKFYKILGYTNTRVRFQEIEHKTVYDDGKTGPHYYSDPRHCIPVQVDGEYKMIGPIRTKSYKILTSGTMCFHPEEFYAVYGAWNGEPLEEYNYH